MKLGIVIPWFGRDLKGGAEQHAWHLASRLAPRGHEVEVLTTCCRSHQDDWSTNHLADGVTREPEGFQIRRFRVVERNRADFDEVTSRLLAFDRARLKPGVSPVSRNESRIFVRELIKSPDLLHFLRTHREEFDSFVFLPYLYGPVLEGIAEVGSRAILLPCLHDEAYAYLPEVAEAFYRVRRILFISEGEQELAYRLFGGTIAAKSFLVGAGVELNDAGSTNGSKTATGRFLLYLGRKDEGKNVPLLLNAFHRFRSVRPNSDLKLVLAGHGKVPDPATNGSAVDLGLVSESKKRELLASCTALVQPSENESFSRVMMEAWLCARPVAGHTRCPATSVAIHHAGGGWLAETEDDWARLFVEIDRTGDETLGQFGVRGRAYARKMADWALVVQRYEEALNGDSPKSIRSNAATQSPVPAINQFLPNLAYGDAISRKAVWIRDELRQAGFDSNIFVQFVDPRVAHECAVFSLRALEDSDALIYHHSIGAEMTPHLMKFPGPKYLIYHNITPGEFFEAYRPNFAQRLYRGRQELAQLARHFPHSAGASAFNARELARSGFNEPGVLPLAIDPGKWALAPDPGVMEQMQDGRTNILFVGRFAPNKKQDDLLTAFAHYLHHDPDARLILVGKPEEEDPYVVHVQNVLRALRLERSVVVPGSIDDAQLAAYYRTAHLFWSMSEHEGFCVPLIEAMWFDLPILAFKAAAVPETLAEAGLMFTSKENWPQLAAIARLIVTDPGLREKLIAAQRTRRLQFLPARVRPILMKMAATLIPHQVTAGEAAWTDNA